MNKVFLGLILAVCVLGMALVMLNDRLGRKSEPRPPAQAAAMSDAEIAMNARARELAEAAKSLVPPEEENAGRTGGPQAAGETGGQEMPRISGLPEPAAVADKGQQDARPQAAPPAPVKPEPAAQTVPKPVPAKSEPQKMAPMKPEPQKPAQAKQDQPKQEQKPAPQKADETKGGKEANRFVIYARDKGATVRVGGNGKMDYSSMTLDNPDRIVVDIAGHWKFPPNPGVPKNELVSSVRVGQNGDKTRLVIDLKGKPRKVVLVPFKGGDGVDVRVDK